MVKCLAAWSQGRSANVSLEITAKRNYRALFHIHPEPHWVKGPAKAISCMRTAPPHPQLCVFDNGKSMAFSTYDFHPKHRLAGCEIIFSTSLSNISEKSSKEAENFLSIDLLRMLNESFSTIKHLGRREEEGADRSAPFHHFAISIQFISISFLGASFVWLSEWENEKEKSIGVGWKRTRSFFHSLLWPVFFF